MSEQVPPTEEQPRPRPRLERSTTDRIVGGVAGGLGRYTNIDPLAIRIAFVILSFAGGIGIFAYLIGLAFMPPDDETAPPPAWGPARTIGISLLALAAIVVLAPSWIWGPGLPLLVVTGVVLYLLVRVIREDGTSHFGRLAARTAIGIVLVALAVGGFAAAAAGSALGGGIVVAGLVIACGVGLVGGAFRGGARWLIAPALVLGLPLAAVAATDLDVRGSWGERHFLPLSAAELEDGYEMGVGELRVDARDLTLPPGRTVLPVEVGMGEIIVLAPPGTCVTVDADIAVGVVHAGDGEEGGVDLEVRDRLDPAPGARNLHVVADIGVGALRIGEHVFDLDGDPLFDAGAYREACR